LTFVEKPVPENLRKKTERDTRLANALKAKREQRAKDVVGKKAEWLKRGASHHNDYLKEERRLVEARRNANANGEMFVEGQPKVLLVIRVKGINKVAPKQKLILRLLRLRQIHNAVFVRVNKATLNMLQRIQPYVTYG